MSLRKVNTKLEKMQPIITRLSDTLEAEINAKTEGRSVKNFIGAIDANEKVYRDRIWIRYSHI